MADKSSETLNCSFCAKSQHEVLKLISAPQCCICNECVELCVNVLRQDGAEGAAGAGLDFGPAHVEAGSVAISNFLDHVRTRYPDGNVAVSILRQKNTLRMVIKFAGGGTEMLERSLDVAGQTGG